MREPTYTINDLDFGDFKVMSTSHGWWSHSNRVVALFVAVKEYKKLKRAWEAAGITEKEWRNFIKLHPAFNKWRKDYWWQKRYGHMFPTLPSRMYIQENHSPASVTSPLRGPEERITVIESFDIKIIENRSLIPSRFLRKRVNYLPSSDEIIYLPSSPYQLTKHPLAKEIVRMADNVKMQIIPVEWLQKENVRERERGKKKVRWTEENKDNPLVKNGSVWIVTQAGDK